MAAVEIRGDLFIYIHTYGSAARMQVLPTSEFATAYLQNKKACTLAALCLNLCKYMQTHANIQSIFLSEDVDRYVDPMYLEEVFR